MLGEAGRPRPPRCTPGLSRPPTLTPGCRTRPTWPASDVSLRRRPWIRVIDGRSLMPLLHGTAEHSETATLFRASRRLGNTCALQQTSSWAVPFFFFFFFLRLRKLSWCPRFSFFRAGRSLTGRCRPFAAATSRLTLFPELRTRSRRILEPSGLRRVDEQRRAAKYRQTRRGRKQSCGMGSRGAAGSRGPARAGDSLDFPPPNELSYLTNELCLSSEACPSAVWA